MTHHIDAVACAVQFDVSVKNLLVHGTHQTVGCGVAVNHIFDIYVASVLVNQARDERTRVLADEFHIGFVEELIEKNGQIVAVQCSNGVVYEGQTFISDIHPTQTFELVRQSKLLKGIFRKRIGWLENTFGMFTLSLVLKPNTLRYFNHNKYVYRKSDVWSFYHDSDSVGGVMISARVPEKGVFANQIDIMTPMLWSSCEKWADTTVGHRGKPYMTMKAEKAKACVELAETVIPGLGNMVSDSYTSTPLTYHDYTKTPNGSAYGVRRDCRNLVLTMLSPRTPVPNLLLTGQNLMLHGLEGVSMSALQTCGEILGKDYIEKIISG